MHLPIFQWYYSDIREGSHGGAAFTFWTNLLLRYFSADDNYGISPEDGVHGKSDDRSDITANWLVVRSVTAARIVICESRRRAHEDQPARWKSAKEQLLEYMDFLREESGSRGEILYGVVAIGRWCQFFELRPEAQSLSDLSDAEARQFEIKMDEDKIDAILFMLHEKSRTRLHEL